MQAVGTEVIVAILLMILPFIILIIKYWDNMKQFYLHNIADHLVVEEPQEQRQRRRRLADDQTCAICLLQPKKLRVSSTCGHSFCGNCIFLLYERIDQKIKCPLCRHEMNLLFKCFEDVEPQDQVLPLIAKIKDYNRTFDDNRPLLRRILQFPYILRRLRQYIFRIQFLAYFLRSVSFIRLIFLCVFYIILPMDILPQRFVGIIGFVDDLLIIAILVSYVVAIVAAQYYRAHH